MKINFVYTTFKVSQYLKLKARIPPALCSNIVYQFSCLCDLRLTYIGMSTRHLSIRVGEHLGFYLKTESSVEDYITSCNICANTKFNINWFLLVVLAFPFNQGFVQRMMFLNSVLFRMSFALARTSPISSFTTSRSLLFGFSFFLLHHSFFYKLLVSPHDMSIPPQLPSLIIIPNRSILTVPLMYSFLILSFLVTLIANPNISFLQFSSLLLVSLQPPPSQSIHHCWSHH